MKREHAASDLIAAPISALVLDDNDFDRRRLCRMSAVSGLEMDVVSVPTIAQMRARLDSKSFDVIFLDYRLSNETGLDALGHIQEHDVNSRAAKIMLTGHLKLDVAVTALKNGCHDYISKDELSPQVLWDTVHNVLAKSRQQVMSQVSQEDMIDKALYDLAVTRLPGLLADVLASQEVQSVIAPALQAAIADGISQSLARYDLPQNPMIDAEINGLVRAMAGEHQIRLMD